MVTRLRTEVGLVVVHTRPRGPRLGQRRARVTPRATAMLVAMHAVAQRRIPQSVQGSPSGGVATGQSVPAGVTQARATVRHQAGKTVACGLPSRLRRLGGGAVWGMVLRGGVDASQRPWPALAGYRAIFGAQATPALIVYARGGSAPAPRRALANAGVKARGMQPTGQGTWCGAEAVGETVRSARGKPAGRLGTRQTDTEGFNKPKERLWQTLEMAGPRSILSFNLNKLMRDLVRANG